MGRTNKVLLRNGELVEDRWRPTAEGNATLPDGPIVVTLAQWREQREALLAREAPLGIRLASDQPPSEIAPDLPHFDLVALEFPVFSDGRAYSYARLLRERYCFQGELRAVGDVLLEQLHAMARCGFDAFEFESAHPLDDWRTAQEEVKVWYQPTGDGRPTALQQRQRRA